MRTNTNKLVIEGYVYQHNLNIKKVERADSPNLGKEFISGTLDVATDENCMNTLSVHFTYVTETTKNGSKNFTYAALKKIIDEGKTVLTDGKENAMKVKCTPAIALNDFYPQGQDELVSTPRNEGGFVTIINKFDLDEKDRNKFTVDMLINKVTHVEADPEKGIEQDFTRVSGAIFNFRNDLLPFTVVARDAGAMNYFEGLNVTGAEPVYTQLWGKIASTTVKKASVTESAFGEDSVETSTRTVKEYIVTGAKKVPYDYGTDETITDEDVKKAIQDRNVMLAEVKKRSEEYYNNKNNAIASEGNTTVPAGGFQF